MLRESLGFFSRQAQLRLMAQKYSGKLLGIFHHKFSTTIQPVALQLSPQTFIIVVSIISKAVACRSLRDLCLTACRFQLLWRMVRGLLAMILNRCLRKVRNQGAIKEHSTHHTLFQERTQVQLPNNHNNRRTRGFLGRKSGPGSIKPIHRKLPSVFF